jgi:hypothetical protein
VIRDEASLNVRPQQIALGRFETVGDYLVAPIVRVNGVRHPVGVPDDAVKDVGDESGRCPPREGFVLVAVRVAEKPDLDSLNR